MNQGPVRTQQMHRRLAVILSDCVADLILRRRNGGIRTAHLFATAPLFFLDHGGDLGIFAISRDRQGGRSIAVRPNAFAGVGPGLH
jgi:hypothetical protein